MKNPKIKFSAFGAALFLLLGIFAADSANAQTKKKNSKPTTTTSTLPQIISTADQYQEQNQQIVTGNVETPTTETQPETFDEKLDKINTRLQEMNTRMQTMEGVKQSEYEARQKRLLMNLDILTRAEQRAESLRKQLFELIEKENTIKTKLETIDYDARPEMIERQVALVGSLRPEELREAKRKNLEAEKRNLSSLLTEIQTTRIKLEANVQKADQMVEKIRAVLEKDIDDALNEETKEQ